MFDNSYSSLQTVLKSLPQIGNHNLSRDYNIRNASNSFPSTNFDRKSIEVHRNNVTFIKESGHANRIK